MKKKLSIALAACAVVLMTGCGKTDKLTCTNEQSFGSATLKTEAVITFKDDYATKTVTTNGSRNSIVKILQIHLLITTKIKKIMKLSKMVLK